MSKRYTDRNKWEDPWFRRLSPNAKILWLFLCDRCDNSGTWEIDPEQFKFFTGLRSDVANLCKELLDRIVMLENDRLLIGKFVLFQQGKKLSEAKAAHRGIKTLLNKHELIIDENGLVKPKSIPCVSHGHTIPMVSSLCLGRGNGQRIQEEGSVRGETIALPAGLDCPEFVKAWEEYVMYRRKSGRKKLNDDSIFKTWRRLAGYPVADVLEAIELTIGNGWTMINPEWLDHRQTKQKIKGPENDPDYYEIPSDL